jgi:Tol biopolymer transport system component
VLATAAAVATGASMLPTRVLDPYGPARNGSMAYQVDGDIYLADTSGDDPTAIITGPANDGYAGFSHDGTRIFFARQDADGTLNLMVALGDGSDVRALKTAWTGDYVDISPDDSQLAMDGTPDGHPGISIVATDGSGSIRTLDTGAIEPVHLVLWRPPDGQELIFLGHPAHGSTDLGMYGIQADGTNLRQIGDIKTGESQTAPLQISLQDPVLSPDGTTIAYWSWEAKDGGSPDAYVHVRGLVTGQDRRLALDPVSDPGASYPHFSPDGSMLLFDGHSHSTPGLNQLIIAPVDGSQPGRAIGPSYYYGSRQGFDFSPDGTKVYLTTTAGTSIIDVAGDATVETPASILTVPSWQRLAP